METDSINLIDKTKEMFVNIKLSKDGKYWERWVSFDKKKWVLENKLKSFDEVLKSQQDLINKNYVNLFNVITKK